MANLYGSNDGPQSCASYNPLLLKAPIYDPNVFILNPAAQNCPPHTGSNEQTVKSKTASNNTFLYFIFIVLIVVFCMSMGSKPNMNNNR